MGREIVRHYAHLSERIQGLASGARLSIDSVMELFVRAARDELAGDPLFAAGLPLARSTEAGDTKLARTLAVAASSGSTWVARRSAPEVGFASIELTLPWLATAIAGVNEAGVAAVFAPRPPGGHSECTRSSAPSPILLVQECLQRFDSIEGCLDWASKRPVAGNACLLVADAAGGAAAVEIEGEERRVTQKLDPSDPSSGLGPASAMEEPDGATLLVVARPAERLLQVRLPGAGAPVALGVHA